MISFQDYLDNLPAPSRDIAKEVWSALNERFESVRDPVTCLTDCGGFYFAWDRDEHHFDIDVFADRSTEWFYRNRSTGECEGEDCSAGMLTDAFAHRFALVALSI